VNLFSESRETMGYGVLVGMKRVKVLFFHLVENKMRKIPLE